MKAAYNFLDQVYRSGHAFSLVKNTNETTAIKRDDGLVVTLQEVTDTSLKLALTWTKTTLGSGRIESVSGQHVFSFGK